MASFFGGEKNYVQHSFPYAPIYTNRFQHAFFNDLTALSFLHYTLYLFAFISSKLFWLLLNPCLSPYLPSYLAHQVIPALIRPNFYLLVVSAGLCLFAMPIRELFTWLLKCH
jgi:hypothetical protein